MKPAFGALEYAVEVHGGGMMAGPARILVKRLPKHATVALLHNRIAAAHAKRYPTRPTLHFALTPCAGASHDLVDSRGVVLVASDKVTFSSHCICVSFVWTADRLFACPSLLLLCSAYVLTRLVFRDRVFSLLSVFFCMCVCVGIGGTGNRGAGAPRPGEGPDRRGAWFGWILRGIAPTYQRRRRRRPNRCTDRLRNRVGSRQRRPEPVARSGDPGDTAASRWALAAGHRHCARHDHPRVQWQ
nr:hypothetical protein [Pandoravirus belohorizontensis]